jgi:hypothetical protein
MTSLCNTSLENLKIQDRTGDTMHTLPNVSSEILLPTFSNEVYNNLESASSAMNTQFTFQETNEIIIEITRIPATHAAPTCICSQSPE